VEVGFESQKRRQAEEDRRQAAHLRKEAEEKRKQRTHYWTLRTAQASYEYHEKAMNLEPLGFPGPNRVERILASEKGAA
jgi:hypothetical protein